MTPNVTTKRGEVKAFYAQEAPDYILRLEPRKNDTELHGLIYPKKSGDIIKVKDLENVFASLNVQGEIDRKLLEQFCARACRGVRQEGVLLVKSIPPEDGVDGYLEFFAKPTSKHLDYLLDDNEKVNHQNLHLFDNVMENQVIAKLHPPKPPGKEGLSVIGEKIPPREAVPLSVFIGDNVRFDRDTSTYIALINGRVVYEKDALSVTDVYVIEKDVNYSVGNIDFVGYVEVKGDVFDGFNIKAAKGIKIHGHVGSCRLESAGDIELLGGMSGEKSQERGFVFCGGVFSARYLDNVYVEAGQDIRVVKEIVNSTIKCRGAVLIPEGSILGGECIALKGIEAGELGSKAGIRTYIVNGMDYTQIERLKELAKEIAVIQEDVAKIRINLLPLLKNPEGVQSLSEEKRRTIKQMGEELKELIARQSKFQMEINAIKAKIRREANNMINVRKAMYNCVMLSLGNVLEKEITAPMFRQMTLLEHSRDRGEIRIIDYHSMKHSAAELEQKMAHLDAVKEIKSRRG